MNHEPTVDAVLLDIGGVLMDWDPRHLFRKVIDDEEQREWFLTEVCGPQWNRRQDEGRSWADAVAEAVGRHPHHEEWIRTYDERWVETLAGLYPETLEVVREVKSHGTPIYALTNFSAEKWALAREHYPELAEFDAAVVSGEERLAKPDPELYRLVIERFDLTPRRTYFTDDLQVNIDAARDAGIDAEVFTSAASLRADLVKRGVLRP